MGHYNIDLPSVRIVQLPNEALYLVCVLFRQFELVTMVGYFGSLTFYSH